MEPILKRTRKMETKRWTDQDKTKLLTIILEDPLKFEKPTAHVFYHNLIKTHPEFADYGWVSMRDKMRNLRVKYTKAIDWRRNTGSGLQVDDPEKSIREYLLKICPDFDVLDSIFGGKKNIENEYGYDSEDLLPGELVEVLEMPESGTPVLEPYSSLPGPSSRVSGASSPVNGPSTPVEEVASRKDKPKNALSFLAEVQSKKTLFLEKKLELEEKCNILKLELEREKLEFERKKINLEMKLKEEEIKLKREELRNNFELEKMKLQQEKEIRMYELRLKYNKENDE